MVYPEFLRNVDITWSNQKFAMRADVYLLILLLPLTRTPQIDYLFIYLFKCWGINYSTSVQFLLSILIPRIVILSPSWDTICEIISYHIKVNLSICWIRWNCRIAMIFLVGQIYAEDNEIMKLLVIRSIQKNTHY